jgi:hypothetical protein
MVYNFPDADLGLATRQNFRDSSCSDAEGLESAKLGERTLCFVKERL